jgi:hypothetical protein
LQLFLRGDSIGLHARDGRIDFPPALGREFLRSRIELVRCFAPSIQLRCDLTLEDSLLLLAVDRA